MVPSCRELTRGLNLDECDVNNINQKIKVQKDVFKSKEKYMRLMAKSILTKTRQIHA